MPRNAFINPAGTAVPGWPGSAGDGWNANGSRWDWLINHGWEGEEEMGIARSIEASATVDGTGVVRQQGAETPLRLVRRGTILAPAQHAAMTAWARLARSQTIYYEEFNGDSYEVLIVAFRSHKEGVMANPRGGADAPMHLWRYTIEMDVLNVLAGTWA